jgi:succinyl-CoA synthetase alpha subunit
MMVLVSEIEPPGPWRLAQVMNQHEDRSSERIAFFAGRALDRL